MTSSQQAFMLTKHLEICQTWTQNNHMNQSTYSTKLKFNSINQSLQKRNKMIIKIICIACHLILTKLWCSDISLLHWCILALTMYVSYVQTKRKCTNYTCILGVNRFHGFHNITFQKQNTDLGHIKIMAISTELCIHKYTNKIYNCFYINNIHWICTQRHCSM